MRMRLPCFSPLVATLAVVPHLLIKETLAIDHDRSLQSENETLANETTTIEFVTTSELVDADFASLLTMTDLNDTILSPGGEATVFAPALGSLEAAFDEGLLAVLSTSEWRLHRQSLIAFHMTLGSLGVSELPSEIITWNQERIFVNSTTEPTEMQQSNNTLVYNIEKPGAQIVEADIVADNGIVHIVDRVLQPSFTTRTAMDLYFAQYGVWNDGLVATGLDDLFRDKQNIFTVFAPSNEAFDATFTPEEIDFLFQPEHRELFTEFLLDHVVPGVYPLEDIVSGTSLENLSGRNISFSRQVSAEWEGVRRVLDDQASVNFPDFLVINGVVHGLDRAILRPDLNIKGEAAQFLSSSAISWATWGSMIFSAGLLTFLPSIF